MKACKCDVCGTYFDALPRGVIFDNEDKNRYDLCLDCLNEVLKLVDRKKVGLDGAR